MCQAGLMWWSRRDLFWFIDWLTCMNKPLDPTTRTAFWFHRLTMFMDLLNPLSVETGLTKTAWTTTRAQRAYKSTKTDPARSMSTYRLHSLWSNHNLNTYISNTRSQVLKQVTRTATCAPALFFYHFPTSKATTRRLGNGSMPGEPCWLSPLRSHAILTTTADKYLTKPPREIDLPL